MTELIRFICQYEDCNRSFYTTHPGRVVVCPYCLNQDLDVSEAIYELMRHSCACPELIVKYFPDSGPAT